MKARNKTGKFFSIRGVGFHPDEWVTFDETVMPASKLEIIRLNCEVALEEPIIPQIPTKEPIVTDPDEPIVIVPKPRPRRFTRKPGA